MPPVAGPPLVSIIVPCRNEARYIDQFVRTLLAMEAPAGGFEVIVVDGRSDDGTREVLERYRRDDRLELIDNPRGTVPHALNLGIEQARGRFVCRLDVHMGVEHDYLTRCLNVWEETQADTVGGPCTAVGTTWMGQAIAAAFHSKYAMGRPRWHDPGYTGEADTVFGFFMERARLRELGPFDDELVRNQDDEFNLRLVRSGGRVWQSSDIRITYYVRSSLRTLWHQQRQYGFWKVRVIQKHRLPASPRHLAPAALVILLASSAVLAPWLSLMRAALALLVVAYGALVVVATVEGGLRRGWKVVPALPAVVATYHFAYGWGFLNGCWRFLVMRREAPSQMAELTR